jgi:hypothetical protein
MQKFLTQNIQHIGQTNFETDTKVFDTKKKYFRTNAKVFDTKNIIISDKKKYFFRTVVKLPNIVSRIT